MVGTTRKRTIARLTILPSIIVFTVASLANNVPNATVLMVMTTSNPSTARTGHSELTGSDTASPAGSPCRPSLAAPQRWRKPSWRRHC